MKIVILVSMKRTWSDYFSLDFVSLFLIPPYFFPLPFFRVKFLRPQTPVSLGLLYVDRGRGPPLTGLWQTPPGSKQTSNRKGEMHPFMAVWDLLSLLFLSSLAQTIEIVQCRMCHLQFPGEKCSRGRGICTAFAEESCTTGRIFKRKLLVCGRKVGQRKQTEAHQS